MMMTQKLTRSDLAAAYDRPDFEGFGYLGGRRYAFANLATEANVSDKLAEITYADDIILAVANGRGWDADRLFEWMNSKDGRWFADYAFGGSDIEQALRYL